MVRKRRKSSPWSWTLSPAPRGGRGPFFGRAVAGKVLLRVAAKLAWGRVPHGSMGKDEIFSTGCGTVPWNVRLSLQPNSWPLERAVGLED